MDRRAFLGAFGLGFLGWPLALDAQPKKMLRVGVLSPFSSASQQSLQPFRDALRDLGYPEGPHMTFEYRWADGKSERLPELAAELVRSKVDVLLSAWGTPAALAAKNSTTSIPVVAVAVADPVSVGLVASLAQPGGNVTASTFLSDETLGKQLQLLKEADARISRVAILTNPDNPVYAPLLKDIEATARAIRVEVVRLGVRGPGDVEPAFETAKRERVQGLVVLRDTVLITHGAKMVELAARYRLPAMYGMREFVDAGGLMSFEPSLPDLYRRAAQLVDKILKGAKPAALPVDRSTKFELAINLKTAKTLGLTIPQPLRLRADALIQ
ncbi:MAG TPA: ABC transporter substrate-binding protein [Candidatus Acidoferrales bacterium]|nr:ABC transporter substrate-binding protein [Candidatus Acidoferrales bacterium]